MTAPSDGDFPDLSSEFPTPARMYDYVLGGKDNYEIDRQAVQAVGTRLPGGVDAARNNRRFLYRVVRFLARDAGITQFLDLGSGLPTQNNVHQVAQQFQPHARVVYVDNDPIVLAHGRALLAQDDSTTVIAADLTKPAETLAHPQVVRLIDFSQPVAVLLLAVGHSIVDDATVEEVLAAVRDAVTPGSYLAYSQMCGVDRQAAVETTEVSRAIVPEWKNRTPEDVVGFLRGLEPVEPGLVNVVDWRPDPTQPPLLPVDEPLRPYQDAVPDTRLLVFGGVARKP